MEYWTAENIQQLTDGTLTRSLLEFRHALGLLRRNGLQENEAYVREMDHAATLMEAECARRSIVLPNTPREVRTAVLPPRLRRKARRRTRLRRL